MDNLARNAMLAKEAGMSYGRWKAMQEPVKPEKKTPEGWIPCKHCGEPFNPGKYRTKKYCCDECRIAYGKKRDAERKKANESCT